MRCLCIIVTWSFRNCKQTTWLIIIFQKGIKLLFIDWTRVWRTGLDSWEDTFSFNVDFDIVRFVLELTKNPWLYRYHIIRRWLFVLDRIFDIVSSVLFPYFIYDSTPRWPVCVCLGIYIVLRVISFALYSNTLLCKCYAVRTVILTVISSLFCTAAFTITISMTRPDKASIPFVVALMILFCTFYICPIVWTFRKLKFVDDDPLQFLPEMKNNRWLIRYHKKRIILMFLDRFVDMWAVCFNIGYYLHSAPHRHVCLVSYITLRLISLALSYNTKLCECYAVRTVIPWIISGLFCGVSLFIPYMLTPGNEYGGYICLIVYIVAYLLMSLLLGFHKSR